MGGGKLLTSCTGCFTPERRKKNSSRSIGGWVGPRASLDILEKRKIF
jgi:hypothetical protein